MKQWIIKYPVFPYLLCFFFVLHGFTANYNFVPVKDSLVLVLLYMGATLVLTLLFRILYRNLTKAGLAAFLIMGFHFFFGAVYDGLNRILPNAYISRYSFILPASFFLFIILFILIKKRKTEFARVKYYLNTLFLVLILVDTVILATKLFTHKKESGELAPGLVNCDTCNKPDVYFIIADEYAGNKELIDKFNYNDSSFLSALSKRGFHTLSSSYSNYNYTPFSIASILDMNYLQLEGKDRSKPDLTYSYEMIRDNSLLQFLLRHGYTFYNHSIFDFQGQPARTREGFLASKTRLITSQTFLSRFDRDIRFNLVTRWKSKKNERILTYAYKKNNEHIYDLTWKLAEEKSKQPRFVYTHLEMPHYPYYYDKNGNERPYETLLEGNQTNKAAYIEYLQYANKKLLTLVDHILESSTKPPLIVLMGDHGFRHFTEPVENQYYFLNLCTLHLPSGKYDAYSDSLTGVNLFRTILNSEFGQNIPLLKDKTTYLKD